MALISNLRVAREVLRLLSVSMGSMLSIRRVDNWQDFVGHSGKEAAEKGDSKTLDLGCGFKPKNPFGAKSVYGIDIVEGKDTNVRYADLIVEQVPFPDQTFDFVSAFDFFEHVPRIAYTPNRRFPFVELMNEVWRTLKPGGMLLSHTPVYPFSVAFRDPAHVNIITHETFPLYFDDATCWARAYGFVGAFEVVDQALCGAHLLSLLKKANGVRRL